MTSTLSQATGICLAHTRSVHIVRDQWLAQCDATIDELLAEKIRVIGLIDSEIERVRKSKAAMRSWSDEFARMPTLAVVEDEDGAAEMAAKFAHDSRADNEQEAA